MREQNDANQWGWDAAAKRSELAHDDARFVLVRGGGGSVQAFRAVPIQRERRGLREPRCCIRLGVTGR